MLKHLALLATLAAPAIAGTAADFETSLSETLRQADYRPGAAFSVVLTMRDLPENAATVSFGDTYHLINKERRYWGFNTEQSSNITTSPNCTQEVNGTNYTYTAYEGELPTIWAQNETGTAAGIRNASDNITINIDCDGTDTRITLNYSLCFITDTFVLKGTALDASQLRLAPSANIVDYNITVDDARLSAGTQGIIIIGGMALCSLLMFVTSKLRPNKKKAAE
jgi:hypothetical protein